MEIDLAQLIDDCGLSAYKSDLLQLARNSIRIKTQPTNENDIPLGGSKFGGYPDLPPNIPYPFVEGRPLHFLAQINLPEVAPYDTESLLPPSGTLAFFWDAWDGYFPINPETWKVFYYDIKQTPLFRIAPLPLAEENARSNYADNLTGFEPQVFKVCSLQFSNELTLPPYDSIYIEELKFTQEMFDKYFELQERMDRLYARGRVVHHLLGYSLPIQSDMQDECQLMTNGVDYYNQKGVDFTNPQIITLLQGRAEWQFLLQVDSDANTYMQWGDAGCIYFWIHRQDLMKLNFNNTYVVYQGH